MSDATARTGVHLPARVRRGDRPAAATINGILDALGPRQLRIGRLPFQQIPDGEDDTVDQFRVVNNGAAKIVVRGGVWQIRTIVWDSDHYEPVVEVVEPTDSATITWSGDTDSDDDLSDEVTLTADKDLWAKLDRSSVTTTLTLHLLASGATPTAGEEIYWHKLAELDYTSGSPDTVAIEPIHTGSIHSDLEPKKGATTTYAQPSTGSAASTTWRSHNDGELVIDRHRIYLDPTYYIIKDIKWTETYSTGGRLLSIGAETVVATLDLDPVSVTVVTAAQYDTSSHQLQVKTRTLTGFAAGTESGWTEVVTFQPCPT